MNKRQHIDRELAQYFQGLYEDKIAEISKEIQAYFYDLEDCVRAFNMGFYDMIYNPLHITSNMKRNMAVINEKSEKIQKLLKNC